MTTPRQRQELRLAALLHVQPRQVRNYIARGMPTTPDAAALRWHAAHIDPLKSNKGGHNSGVEMAKPETLTERFKNECRQQTTLIDAADDLLFTAGGVLARLAARLAGDPEPTAEHIAALPEGTLAIIRECHDRLSEHFIEFWQKVRTKGVPPQPWNAEEREAIEGLDLVEPGWTLQGQ